jgi:hypothetical protein
LKERYKEQLKCFFKTSSKQRRILSDGLDIDNLDSDESSVTTTNLNQNNNKRQRQRNKKRLPMKRLKYEESAILDNLDDLESSPLPPSPPPPPPMPLSSPPKQINNKKQSIYIEDTDDSSSDLETNRTEIATSNQVVCIENTQNIKISNLSSTDSELDNTKNDHDLSINDIINFDDDNTNKCCDSSSITNLKDEELIMNPINDHKVVPCLNLNRTKSGIEWIKEQSNENKNNETIDCYSSQLNNDSTKILLDSTTLQNNFEKKKFKFIK